MGEVSVPASNYSGYTDHMWLADTLRDGHFGPIDPLTFPPARQRLYYFDHSAPEFFVRPLITTLGFEGEEQYSHSTVKVDFDGDALIYRLNGAYRAHIERDATHDRPPPGYWRIFCSHLQFSLYTQTHDFPKEGLVLDFGDAPTFDSPALTYCTANPAQFCVVDPFFIVSNAYLRLQDDLAKNTQSLAEKRDTVFWRGSASGVRTTFQESQRYLLCRQMEISRHRDKLDFGIINTPPPLLAQLTKAFGAVPAFAQPAERVSPDTFALYRYGVDVDGNSNSWGGFFTKMLSQAYLIRVASWKSYRQWYYQRLEGQGYFSTVASDLSDFDAVLDQVMSLSLDEITHKAMALHRFASSMTVYDEIARNNKELHAWLG